MVVSKKVISLKHQTTTNIMNLLPKSIEERTLNLMLNGVEFKKAILTAIDEEQKLIEEMIAQTSERSKKAKNQIIKNTYALIHLKNALK